QELGDLLVVVPDPGHVDGWRHQLRSELQLHCDASLHVDGAPTPQVVDPVDGLEARRQVVVQRNGVDVTGNHHALGPSQVRAGDHGVTVADDLQVRASAQTCLDHIRYRRLVAGHRLDVAQVAS